MGRKQVKQGGGGMKRTRKYWRELVTDRVIYFAACCAYMASHVFCTEYGVVCMYLGESWRHVK